MSRGSNAAVLAGVSFLCVLCAFVSGYEMKAVTRPVIMAESPFWSDETNTVIFVDVIGEQVLRYDPQHPGELKNITLSESHGRVTPAVPVQDSNLILVGKGRTMLLVDVDWGQPGEPARLRTTKAMTEVEVDMPNNRFNDGKADHSGRLWVGTMDDSQTSRRRRRRRRRRSTQKTNKGELFRFNLYQDSLGGHSVTTSCEVPDGLHIPNGMVWTKNNEGFYLADSATRAVYYFDFNSEAGKLKNRRSVFDFAKNGVPGAPDGLTIDVDGNLWIACVHGGRVIQADPRTGELLQTIMMGVTNPSAAEWGGPNRDVLYVTTARYKMDELQLAKEPEAGCLFAITGLSTHGLPNLPHRARSRYVDVKVIPPQQSTSSTHEISTTTTEQTTHA